MCKRQVSVIVKSLGMEIDLHMNLGSSSIVEALISLPNLLNQSLQNWG